jgi:predicted Zn finger-like uncharacterized protein
MYTQCPECLAVYRLKAESLALGRGRVRCGSCAAEFDALACLTDELPGESFTALKRRPTGTQIPQLNVPALRPNVDRPPTDQRELFVDFDKTLRAQRDNPPSFARRDVPVSVPRAAWGWVSACVLLALMLAMQMAWVYREPLLRNERVRDFALSVCARVGCKLPSVSDRVRIALMARDVRPHPSEPGALIITATIANQAEFDQPFPIVEITLSDVNERRVAMRRFKPAEYVSESGAISRGLPAGATAMMSLEVEDPGKSAVAFEFRFL